MKGETGQIITAGVPVAVAYTAMMGGGVSHLSATFMHMEVVGWLRVGGASRGGGRSKEQAGEEVRSRL